MGAPYGPFGFDSSSQYHRKSDPMRGVTDPIDTSFWVTEHHNIIGQTVNDGKAEAFSKVKQGLNVDSLNEKVEAWGVISTEAASRASELHAAMQATFAAWSGDDAEKAYKIFQQTVTSADALDQYTTNMHTGVTGIAKAAASAVGVSSDGPGFGDKLAGGLGFGDGDGGDGGKDVAAYEALVGAVNQGRGTMPATVEWQTKTDGGDGGPITNKGGDSGGAGGSGAGVGGVSAPNVGGGAPTHAAVSTHAIKPVDQLGGRPLTSNPDQTGALTGAQALTHYPGAGTDGLGGSGVGLDTGSSLAGYDGGAGAGGGGAGLGGGGLGGGLGGSSTAGLGGGAGSGLSGGAGAGGGVPGGAAGLGGVVPGGGAAGRGGVGGQIAPMRGGAGGGGDESERERSTWLQEDDDVWGETDAPPSVIS